MASADARLIVFGALVIGSGYGVTTPSSSAILADRTPAGMRAFIYSVKQTGVPIGGALAGALIPLLIAAFDWRAAALIALFRFKAGIIKTIAACGLAGLLIRLTA